MSEILELAAAKAGDCIHQLVMASKLQDEDYKALCARYDDALKRINDLTAELEALRTELGRRA